MATVYDPAIHGSAHAPGGADLPPGVGMSSIATPSAPTSGLSLYPKAIAGRGVPHVLGQVGAETQIQAHLGAAQWYQVCPLSSTTLRTNGSGGAVSATGTVSHVNPAAAVPYYANLAGAASAGTATVGCSTSVALWRRGAAADLCAGFEYDATWYCPDASYNNTGASTGSRTMFGFSGSAVATVLAADHGATATHTAAFMRANVNGGSTDTTWQFVTIDGSTRNVVDTTLTFTAQHVYRMRMFCAAGGTSVYFTIDDLTAGTTQSGSSGSNLPGATTSLFLVNGLFTIDAAVRNLALINLYARSDKG